LSRFVLRRRVVLEGSKRGNGGKEGGDGEEKTGKVTMPG